jgi:hypothetical protein
MSTKLVFSLIDHSRDGVTTSAGFSRHDFLLTSFPYVCIRIQIRIPFPKNDADPCGSGSTRLVVIMIIISQSTLRCLLQGSTSRDINIYAEYLCQNVFSDMSVLPLVFPSNISCFSRGSYKVSTIASTRRHTRLTRQYHRARKRNKQKWRIFPPFKGTFQRDLRRVKLVSVDGPPFKLPTLRSGFNFYGRHLEIHIKLFSVS